MRTSGGRAADGAAIELAFMGIVYIASLGGAVLEVPVMRIMQKRAVITGSTLRPRSADEKARLAAEIERVVWPWVADGKLKPIVDATFPLGDAAKAAALASAEADIQAHVGEAANEGKAALRA